jgi:hypothetical protein
MALFNVGTIRDKVPAVALNRVERGDDKHIETIRLRLLEHTWKIVRTLLLGEIEELRHGQQAALIWRGIRITDAH